MPSPDYPSEIETVKDSVTVEVCNKNILDYTKLTAFEKYSVTETQINSGIRITCNNTLDSINAKYIVTNLETYKTQKLTISANIKSNSSNKGMVLLCFCDKDGKNRTGTIYTEEKTNGRVSLTITIPETLTENTSYLCLMLYGRRLVYDDAKVGDYVDYTNIQLEVSSVETDYTPHQSQKVTIPIQQEMLEGDYIDEIEHHEWGKVVLDGENIKFTDKSGTLNNMFITSAISKFKKPSSNSEEIPVISNYFKSLSTNYIYANSVEGINIRVDKQICVGFGLNSEITTVEQANEWLKEHNVILYAPLEEPLDLELTLEQKEAAEQLNDVVLYNGTNNISAYSNIEPILKVGVYNIVENFDFYISSNGYLIIPKYNIKYLIDFNESSIPIMPEAAESTVRAAGRDGDYVLGTTFEPIPFVIACYTDDNLTSEEKIQAESNVNKFLNEMKNNTKTFAIENKSIFYDVKYNSALTTTNYPSHIKFSIPFKSSESYGKDVVTKKITGNETKESNTVKNVGAIFTIKGPALNPIISFNDYSMEYNMSILEGAKIEINSNKSTVTHTNSDGIKTNVMKYYNHQFPKVENGTNELKILSGIDDESQVKVEWNDLKL